jgi:hypothetical protein
MDDSFTLYGEWTGYSAVVDVNRNTLVLTKDKNWKAEFTFQRVAQDQLILDGAMDGHKIHARLRLFDHNKLPLIRHRLRWVRE